MLPHDLNPTLSLSKDFELPTQVDWKAHLEALPLPTWIGDPDSGNLFVNQAYRCTLGVLKLEEVSGRDWEKNLHSVDREGYVHAWDLFVQQKTERFQEIVRWIRPDTGQVIKLAVRAQRLQSGQFQGWIRHAVSEQALLELEGLTYADSR